MVNAGDAFERIPIMRNELTSVSLPLARGAILKMRSARGMRVECIAGCIWITHDGELRDIVVETGQGHTFDSDRPTLISALDDARLLWLEGVPA
jgi:Protein of unknown function (DUF2917)